MQEQWKPIPDFPNYEVSDHGRVRSAPRIETAVRHGEAYTRTRAGKVLTPSPLTGSNKYRGVNLCRNDGAPRFVRVHRLVAEVFVPNPNNLPVVNHIDHDPSNNKATNLEWTTSQGNTRHSAVSGRMGFICNEVIDEAHKILSGSARPNVADTAGQLGVPAYALNKALRGFRAEHLGLEPIKVAEGREERYQRAVQLRKLGMKHTEIGEVLGITYSAVSRLLSRRRPVAPR